jgi:hypothetical protein
MPGVETAEDLASFFHEDEFAAPVTLEVAGERIEAVKAIFNRPTKQLSLGTAGANVKSFAARIQVSDLPVIPARDDVLELAAEAAGGPVRRFKIARANVDETQSTVSLELREK